MPDLKIGLFAEEFAIVTNGLTAYHIGSGILHVYATPAMIALMEAAACAAIDAHLGEDQTSVGTLVNVEHLAATPLTGKVRARAELTAIDGRKLTFKVEAWDDAELIGKGEHQRVVVDSQKFLAKIMPKMKPASNQD